MLKIVKILNNGKQCIANIFLIVFNVVIYSVTVATSTAPAATCWWTWRSQIHPFFNESIIGVRASNLVLLFSRKSWFPMITIVLAIQIPAILSKMNADEMVQHQDLILFAYLILPALFGYFVPLVFYIRHQKLRIAIWNEFMEMISC